MKNGKNSIIVLSIIGITTLLISIIGATFAYFSIKLDVVSTKKNTVIQSRTLVIEYKTLNQIYYKNIIPGRPKWKAGETPENILKFSLTSPVDMPERNAYDVYLNITENSFETNNMVYYIKQNPCNRSDNTKSYSGDLISELPALKYNYNGRIVDVGVIPAGYKGMLKIAGGAILGSLGCTDNWEVEMWLYETGTEQNIDQGKHLKASVEIDVENVYPADYVFYR